MGEPPSAAIAGETNAAAEKTNAIVHLENRRGDCVGIPDISPSLFDRALYSRREKVNNSAPRFGREEPASAAFADATAACGCASAGIALIGRTALPRFR
jgi:hypothetical protein